MFIGSIFNRFRPIFLGLISLSILATISCQTAGPGSPSVVLEQTEHENATILLEKIDELNEQGKYVEAIPLAKELLGIVEKEKGPVHQGTAACLNILGGLYDSFGDYDEAGPILKRALEINEKLEGMESPNVATSLGLLAKVYMNLGDYLKAEPLAKRALHIREKAQGSDHFMVSTSLNTLGEIYLHLGEYEKAEPLLLRALEIRKNQENAHSVLITLNNLCQLYYDTQEYDPAKSIALAALELGESSLGPDHPHLAETFNLLGKIYAAIGRPEKALHYLRKAQEIDLQSIDHMKGFTSEKQKLRFLAKLEQDLHVFLSLIFYEFPHSSGAIREGLDIVLKRKGVVLEVQKQFQTALLSGDERMLEIFKRLSEVRAMLSKVAFSGPGMDSMEAYRDRMSRLRSEKEQLEIQLSTHSDPYTVYLKKAEADCTRVAAALSDDTALVEFVQLRPFHFKATTENKWGPARYFAFILLAGKPDSVRLVDLGDAQSIDKAISSLKKAVTNVDDPQGERALTLAGQIYSRIFRPLQERIGEIHEVFLSPDGNLNLIPFEIFQQPDGRFLVERFTFNYLACGRDLLGFGGNQTPGRKSLIMGNPDFDLEPDDKDRILTRLAIQSRRSSDTSYSRDLRGLHFKPLPGTEKEVRVISDILGGDHVMLFMGKQALEEILIQIEAPKFLHLATHGFFLADQNINPLFGEDYPRGLSIHPEAQPRPVYIENPFIRSGLALAGANRFLKDPGHASGIVTAEEILGLKLRGTEMVVLSACETGVGEVKVGEGVFGMRRAFTQAGAKSLVMSMWPVPDLETYELMAEFYRNITSGGMNRAQALRQAMLKQIQVVKGRYGKPNPLFWGAFVFLGEP